MNVSVISSADVRELMKSEPDLAVEGVFDYWWLFDREDLTAALFSLTGQLPAHKHSKGEHLGFIIGGVGYCVAGEEYFELKTDTWMRIPQGAAHNFYVPEGGQIIGIEMTAPRCLYEDIEWLIQGPEFEMIEAIRREHNADAIAAKTIPRDLPLPGQ
ncbi:MAG: Mannose-6-phosphate isomerase [Actinomycetota bacterium]|jgi:mannose-6-phosphate isomerase-like protein (cupin superfamily)|nr:Mannose-6-phosphate isomerase [Actinomycetota bacterium]MDQ1504494.1 Mannose-6-phosphate isomerase [Actinomycetota bacterium]